MEAIPDKESVLDIGCGPGHISEIFKQADRKKVEITEQMFVLCEREPCLIENSPSWNISMFGDAVIAETWEKEGIKIYKLVHPKEKKD